MSSERKTVTAPPADLPVGVEGRPSIIGLRLLGTNKELMLSPSLDVTRVGASSDCDIVIANQFISSVHCLIERKGNALVLDDQGSNPSTPLSVKRTSFVNPPLIDHRICRSRCYLSGYRHINQMLIQS